MHMYYIQQWRGEKANLYKYYRKQCFFFMANTMHKNRKHYARKYSQLRNKTFNPLVINCAQYVKKMQ